MWLRTRLCIYACDGWSVYCDKTQMEVSGKQISAMAGRPAMLLLLGLGTTMLRRKRPMNRKWNKIKKQKWWWAF